jgi:hypothetical protein
MGSLVQSLQLSMKTHHAGAKEWVNHTTLGGYQFSTIHNQCSHYHHQQINSNHS